MDSKININLIIEGCLNANALSEQKLFEMYYNFVMHICHRYAHNHEEAEEMLNDTFYKVFKYLNSFNKDFPFLSWLRKITINCCISYIHKYKHEFQTIELEGVSIQSFKIEDKQPLRLADKYIAIIKQLPPAYRMVFNLYVFEEYKHHEIAELLNISVGTSKSNFKRAKDKIAEIMNPMEQIKKLNDTANG